MNEPSRIITCGSNVEILVEDVNTRKIRHRVEVHNQIGPLGILGAGVHQGILASYGWDSIALSSSTTTAPTDPTNWSISFYKDLYTNMLYTGSINTAAYITAAYSNNTYNDSNKAMTISQFSSYAMPIWIKANATFKAPFAAANGTQVYALMWFSSGLGTPYTNWLSSKSNRDCAVNTVAYLVLDPGARFTKTASDIVYVAWTFNWNIPDRTNNLF